MYFVGTRPNCQSVAFGLFRTPQTLSRNTSIPRTRCLTTTLGGHSLILAIGYPRFQFELSYFTAATLAVYNASSLFSKGLEVVYIIFILGYFYSMHLNIGNRDVHY